MICLSVKILTPYVAELLINKKFLAGDVYIFKSDLELLCFHCGGEKLASNLY